MTLAFGVLAVVATWPYARLVSDAILGDGGDVPLSARLFWALDYQGGDPFTTARDFMLAAPDGAEVLRAANLANFLFVGPVWGLGQVIGFVEAFNLYAFAALILSGTAAFVLLDRLRFGVLAAAFGAWVFAFNPNHVDKVFGHAPLAATWILPVVVLALLAKRQRPTAARAVGCGILLAIAFYLNSYLGLFAFVAALVFAVVDYILRQSRSRYDVLRSYYFLALAFVFGLIPLGVSWYFDASSVSAIASARAEAFPGGAAEPELYLLPGPRHPLLGGPMSEWLETNLSWEYTMFFGYTTIALALAGVGLAFARHRRRALGTEERFVVVFAVALTLVGAWASLPSTVQVGTVTTSLLCGVLAFALAVVAGRFVRRRVRSTVTGIRSVPVLAGAATAAAVWLALTLAAPGTQLDLPTPSYAIREATTLFRVFSRFGVLVGLGLVVLAAYALSSLPWRRYRAVIAAAALALVAFELYVGPPEVVAVQDIRTPVTVEELAHSASSRPVLMDVSEPPEYVTWLRGQPPGTLADYPDPLTPSDRWAWKDIFYQQFHEHTLWQGSAGTPRALAAFEELAGDLNDPLTSRVLAVADVRYVVVHRDRYRAAGRRTPSRLCGLELAAAFPAEDVAVYEVDAAADRLFGVRDRGFHGVVNRKVWPEDRGFRWMPEQGTVAVFSPRDDYVFLSGLALSLDRPREVRVFDTARKQVGAWEILTVQTSFRFALNVRKGLNRFVFEATPGAVRTERDRRPRAVAISSLTVAPVAAPSPASGGSRDLSCGRT